MSEIQKIVLEFKRLSTNSKKNVGGKSQEGITFVIFSFPANYWDVIMVF